MPNYDYKCADCGYTFEEFQKMTDEPLRVCPKCKGSLKRLIGSGLAPIFKGSGFYQTDYKNGSSKNKTDGNTSTSGTAASKSETAKEPAKESSTKKPA